MDSIENMLSCMTPARLMIKIWEFSHHFLHSTADKSFNCQCVKYFNICIEDARNLCTMKTKLVLILLCIIFSFIEKNICV